MFRYYAVEGAFLLKSRVLRFSQALVIISNTSSSLSFNLLVRKCSVALKQVKIFVWPVSLRAPPLAPNGKNTNASPGALWYSMISEGAAACCFVVAKLWSMFLPLGALQRRGELCYECGTRAEEVDQSASWSRRSVGGARGDTEEKCKNRSGRHSTLNSCHGRFKDYSKKTMT